MSFALRHAPALAHSSRSSTLIRGVVLPAAAPRRPRSRVSLVQVVGIGGGGSQAVQRMWSSNVGGGGLQWMVMDTDAEALSASPLPDQHKLQVGSSVTLGYSTGSRQHIGRAAAAKSTAEVASALKGSDLVFILAGANGGTGGGAAPIIAAAAKEQGALTVCVATTPTSIAGRQSSMQAVSALRDAADALIVLPSHKLLATMCHPIPSSDAYETADRLTSTAIQAVTELLQTPGQNCASVQDLRQLFANTSSSWIGHGIAAGPDRAERATLAAITSPLRLADIGSASSILIQMSAPAGMSVEELQGAVDVVRSCHAPTTKVMFGAIARDDDPAGQVAVTVIASNPSSSSRSSSAAAVSEALLRGLQAEST